MSSKASQPEARPHRPIRSYVRREGRITRAQQRALTELWPHYGIDRGETPLDLDAAFARQAPVMLEIGFGNGDALAVMAAAHPQHNYLGIEVHRPGVGSLLLKLENHAIGNVRVICADATQVLQQNIADGALAAVYIFFPDPWPKKRHHKRRLLQAEFIQLLRLKLKPGGRLHIATDWRDYAESVMDVLEAAPGFNNVAGPDMYSSRPEYRPETRFERRGRRLGHGVWDLIFERCD